MSEHACPPPPQPSEPAIVVEHVASERQQAGAGAELAQVTGADGVIVWRLVLRPDVEKAEPVTDNSALEL